MDLFACVELSREPGHVPGFGQRGILFHFYAPGNVLCRMEMEYIQFVAGHRVDLTLEHGNRHIITAHIHHISPPGEGRPVTDRQEWPPIPRICELQEGLDTAISAGRGFRTDDHTPGIDPEQIGLRMSGRHLQFFSDQTDHRPAVRGGSDHGE